MIKLKAIVESIPALKEGGKLFGPRAERVTTADMNIIFGDLQKRLGDKFSKFQLSRALPTKADHGDIDIVACGNQHVYNTLKQFLGSYMIDYSKNGNIHSVLYKNPTVNKTVHVDFIMSSEDEFAANYDYLSYNDFSGILGIISRKLNYKYGNQGFFKIYKDKSDRNNEILLTRNLREGLVILGYKQVLNTFDQIQTVQDIVDFIAASDLFDSRQVADSGMNHGDRKRSRPGRPTAIAIRNGLVALNKTRKIEDEDYFLKQEFPHYYQKLQSEIEKINNKTVIKSKYGGEWLMRNFPEVKPGPMIGKIKAFWQSIYGDQLDAVPETELITKTQEFLKGGL